MLVFLHMSCTFELTSRIDSKMKNNRKCLVVFTLIRIFAYGYV